jgi:hypothetical protein
MLAPSLTAMAEVMKSHVIRSLNACHISFKENGAQRNQGYRPQRCRMDEEHVPSAAELDVGVGRGNNAELVAVRIRQDMNVQPFLRTGRP